MCERVRLADAAKELGCSQQAVREHMKLGIWDLGEVISPKRSKKKQYSYYIYRAKLDKILGKEIKPVRENGDICKERERKLLKYTGVKEDT